jgi:hypothetical protein
MQLTIATFTNFNLPNPTKQRAVWESKIKNTASYYNARRLVTVFKNAGHQAV